MYIKHPLYNKRHTETAEQQPARPERAKRRVDEGKEPLPLAEPQTWGAPPGIVASTARHVKSSPHISAESR